MSNIIIVNDNDEVTGIKRRDELDYAKDIYRSTAVWVYNSHGEVLIAQRKYTKLRQPGKWGPSVAGTVEEGEDVDSNALKEIEEEIGLSGYELEKSYKIRVDDTAHQFMQWYVVKVDEPIEFFTPQFEEVEKLQWIKLGDLKSELQDAPTKYVDGMNLYVDIIDKEITT